MKRVENYQNLIFQRRKALKMSITTVASYMKVTRKTYVRMEQGNVSLIDLIKLCELLNFEVLIIPTKYLE